ncbi:MAG: hypothetical protein U0939_19775 [Pirellulales bacterium]
MDDAAFISSFQAAVLTFCYRSDPFALAAESFFHQCLREAQVPTLADLMHYAQSHENHRARLDLARVVHWRRPPSDSFEEDLSPSDDDETETGPFTWTPGNLSHVPDESSKTSVDAHEVDDASTIDTTDHEDDYDADIPVADGSSFRISIDELDTSDVMIAFRTVSRELGICSQEQLLREVARRFGYERLGKRVDESLRGHLRAAIRRRIIRRLDDTDTLCLYRRDIRAYDPDELVSALTSVTRPRCRYEREDLVRSAANYLGFKQVTENVRDEFRKAIRRAIKEGCFEAVDGLLIRC